MFYTLLTPRSCPEAFKHAGVLPLKNKHHRFSPNLIYSSTTIYPSFLPFMENLSKRLYPIFPSPINHSILQPTTICHQSLSKTSKELLLSLQLTSLVLNFMAFKKFFALLWDVTFNIWSFLLRMFSSVELCTWAIPFPFQHVPLPYPV